MNTHLSVKRYWRELLALMMLLLAIVFFRSERHELSEIIPHIRQTDPYWLTLAVFITGISYLFQGGMYRNSFASIYTPLSWWQSILLYLKRNVLGIFLPAGGISALAYAPPQVRKEGFSRLQINQASGLYGLAGILTVILAGIPLIIYSLLYQPLFANVWTGLATLLCIVIILFALIRSIRNKGAFYRFLKKKSPSLISSLTELLSAPINYRKFIAAILCSSGVELCGMLQIYVAMRALGLPASFGASALTYVLSVLVAVVSPFLRGLGAVELAMVYVLGSLGYTPAQALSVTIVYRIVEFWLPMASGLMAFAWKGKDIFLRILPPLFVFSLGLINIISAITPPIHSRLHLLREYIPLVSIHASHSLVLLSGVFLIVIAAFLVKGSRNAWILAMTLSVLSLIGHLGKALDYEEAAVAGITILVLSATYSQYRIRGSNQWMKAGLKIALLNMGAVVLFAFICLYSIDQSHFGTDFTWKESLAHTFRVFFLLNDPGLHAVTPFGHELLWLIRSLGVITWAFLLFTLIKPGFMSITENEQNRQKARMLVKEFGTSSNDYFKLYKDKNYFFAGEGNAFLAYRLTSGFAIVLEEPVGTEEGKSSIIGEFDDHCRKAGLKPVYYRIDESSMPIFSSIGKKKMIIGQEAIIDVSTFTLEGKEKKSLRNGLNSLQKKGFYTHVTAAPQTEGFLAELQSVSNEWLKGFQKQELVFSQGLFDPGEIKMHDIISVQDSEGKVKAFLNIISDYGKNEYSYDLIRKSIDAPGAAMDALVVALIEYTRRNGKQYLNLGMAPMTGIAQPNNAAEQLIKIAAGKIKRFQHYKGLREFKEKYATHWQNKYIIYDNDFDLVQLPMALRAVMKP